jgi:hypothetical protein
MNLEKCSRFASIAAGGVSALLLCATAAGGNGQIAPGKPNLKAASENTQSSEPIPGIRQLMTEVMQHQRALDKLRENYTYKSSFTDQEMDSNGQVKKTETEERDVFFVNSHRIERTVTKDGKPLNDHEQQKETERITKLIEKAEKTPPGEPLEGQETVSVTKLLDIMEATNPRRQMYRGRSTILFDFEGKHDAKTHGIAEDASKKLAGTIWIDEKDRQVAHLEAHFTDNFHVAGGLVANVQKGSSFYFDQAPVNGEIWFPTYAEGRVDARVMLVKGIRQHFTERDSNYERFSVDTQTSKTVTVVQDPKKN